MARSLLEVVKNNLMVTGLFHVRERTGRSGYKELLLVRKAKGRPISLVLEFNDVQNNLWIRPPRYEFSCRTSHFDYAEPETRWTRRKDIISAVVHALQKAEVWPFIANQHFFKLNRNFKFKKADVRESVVEKYDALLREGRSKK